MNRSSKLCTVFLASLLIIIGSASVSAQPFASRSSRASTLPTVITSTITTLYSSDPIANKLCLIDGREGGVFQEGQARNRCSHIEFDTYKLGSLSVGIQGGEMGTIVDLGTWQDLKTNQAFPGIRFENGKIMLFRDPRFGKTEELAGAAQVFNASNGLTSIEAKPGHIYLARITDRHNKDFQILVKLVVLSVKPGEAVTFRWELL